MPWANGEKDAGQAGEGVQLLQLALQAFLLVAQAGRPMPVGDHQLERAFAPGGDMTMLPRRRLQLAFQQSLQLGQALGLVEQRLERASLAQQCAGGAGG